VRAKTSKEWKKVKKYDRKKGRERTFYECPLFLVEFWIF